MTTRLSMTLDRLTAALEAETAALKAGVPVDLHAAADLKARLLLELSTPGAQTADNALAVGDVERLMQLLAENARTLERHMEAVTALAGSLADSMRAVDDDGTYARHAGRRSA
jgi:hypothetical protein